MTEFHVNHSTKIKGKYEEKIIKILSNYFKTQKYLVFPHSSLNIAWGSVFTDLDIILLKDGLVSYVEVKSQRDKMNEAFRQIANVKDFIDFAWVASDKQKVSWNDPLIGFISVLDDKVIIKNQPKQIIETPNFYSILSLKKKCLAKFFIDLKNIKLISKYSLAKKLYYESDICTKTCLKEIVMCGNTCDTLCPINKYEKLVFKKDS